MPKVCMKPVTAEAVSLPLPLSPWMTTGAADAPIAGSRARSARIEALFATNRRNVPHRPEVERKEDAEVAPSTQVVPSGTAPCLH